MPRGATDHPEESVIEVYATLLKRLADAVDVSLHRSGIHYAPFYRHSCLPNRLSISLLLHHCDIAHWRNSTDKRTQKNFRAAAQMPIGLSDGYIPVSVDMSAAKFQTDPH